MNLSGWKTHIFAWATVALHIVNLFMAQGGPDWQGIVMSLGAGATISAARAAVQKAEDAASGIVAASRK